MECDDERQREPEQHTDFRAEWNHIGHAEDEMRDEPHAEAARHRSVRGYR